MCVDEAMDNVNNVMCTCGQLQFMFCFPNNPLVVLGVIHPAYDYHPAYSVLTKMYRMQYEDDPPNILTSIDDGDRGAGNWKLDDDRASITGEPLLRIIPLGSVVSHLLMIP